jgi:hypothetical protein
MKEQLEIAVREYLDNQRSFNDARHEILLRHQKLIGQLQLIDGEWRQSRPHAREHEDEYQSIVRHGNTLLKAFLDLETERRDNSNDIRVDASKTTKHDVDSMMVVVEKALSESSQDLRLGIPRRIELLDLYEEKLRELESFVSRHLD